MIPMFGFRSTRRRRPARPPPARLTATWRVSPPAPPGPPARRVTNLTPAARPPPLCGVLRTNYTHLTPVSPIGCVVCVQCVQFLMDTIRLNSPAKKKGIPSADPLLTCTFILNYTHYTQRHNQRRLQELCCYVGPHKYGQLHTPKKGARGCKIVCNLTRILYTIYGRVGRPKGAIK